MKLTLSVIKADIGSIGGHVQPSDDLLDAVASHVEEQGRGLIIDDYISFTGDDVAILMTHTRGCNDERIHELAWGAFRAGTEVAKRQGLYAAGQDLLSDAFSGNVRGMGPAVGLMLSPEMARGFKFVIMDVGFTKGDRIIELEAPEDLYAVAALLRDTERYVVESITSRATGAQAVAVSTSRLHNIAGKYVGKDDPVMLVRVQKSFPATGEVLAPYAIGAYVAGAMRGSHVMPLMPVGLDSNISYFDGPPIVSCAAFAVHDGKLTEPADAFAHPFWDTVRNDVSTRAIAMRRQGFFGAAMLPMSELEYTGITETLASLDRRFRVRDGAARRAVAGA